MQSADRPTIALLTGSSLCYNPRALKSATTLARAGYRVRVLGAWLDPAFKARDQELLPALPFEFTPVLDTTLQGTGRAIAQLGRRVIGKIADTAHHLAGRERPTRLGQTTWRLLAAARRTPAQLYIAHSEPGLYAGRELLRRGRRVGVDMEDWFSEDLLPQARRHRPLGLLRSLEREILTAGVCSFCPSHAMSTALAAAYDCRPPTVIYNAFPWADRLALDQSTHDRHRRDIPSIYWFSTTIGPGRGVETLIAALPLLRFDVEIHLRGNAAAGFEQWITSQLPGRWRSLVSLHPRVRNDELLSRIAEHDIGFAGEQTYCLHKQLTVSNKMLHYLLGGLAVVASDTEGQREIAEEAPGAVLTYKAEDTHSLAAVLNKLLGSPDRLRRAKLTAVTAAREKFCWELQEPTLLRAVARALEPPHSDAAFRAAVAAD